MYLRYTLQNFLPLSLLEQFIYTPSNLYFLMAGVIQIIPEVGRGVCVWMWKYVFSASEDVLYCIHMPLCLFALLKVCVRAFLAAMLPPVPTLHLPLLVLLMLVFMFMMMDLRDVNTVFADCHKDHAHNDARRG